MRTAVFTSVIAFCGLLLSTVVMAEPAMYRLGSEDTVTITVLRHPELSGDFFVPSDGILNLPQVGQVSLAGKTLAEASEALTKRLAETIRNPQVTVSLRIPRQQRIYVIGAVADPGVFPLSTGWRITEALAAAGGLKLEPAECTASLLRASTGQQQPINLAGVLGGSANANLLLEQGDVLIIQAIERLPIFVTGGVKNPGMYEIYAGLGAVEALALADGLAVPEDEATVTVLRGGKSIGTLDLSTGKQGKELVNISLQRGDVVSVQVVEHLPIYVMGEVRNPGMYDIRSGLGAVEALALAGGLLIPENEATVVVLRNGQQVGKLDLAAAKQGKQLTNIPLQRGDVLKIDRFDTMDIMVAGQVKLPGSYKVKTGDGVLQALTLAGGPLPSAALSRVAVLHDNGTTQAIDLSPSFLAGSGAPNVALASGDLILVPETTARVAVLGYVNQPGYYTIADGKPVTLSEAVAMAGGMERTRSGLSMVAVLHTDGEKQSRNVYDLQKYLKDGDARNNPQIQAGDVIFVPETNHINWESVFRTLSMTSVVYTIADHL